jgi:hypothetical protein
MGGHRRAANATSAGTGLTSCAPPGFNAVTDTNTAGRQRGRPLA